MDKSTYLCTVILKQSFYLKKLIPIESNKGLCEEPLIGF